MATEEGTGLNKCFGQRRALLQANTRSPSGNTTSTADTRLWISFGQPSMKRQNKGAISDSHPLSLLPTSVG